MNRYVLTLDQIATPGSHPVGGKAAALSGLLRHGMNVPNGFVVNFEAYHRFLEFGHLRERIFFEINRKPFAEMRWEEVWDASLRIRNMFVKAPLPPDMTQEIVNVLNSRFDNCALVLRSSAAGEDSKSASFAGLHDSYVNVRGTDDVLKHIKLVWASLWSDRALLYRKELELDVGQSAMAVIIQELVDSRVSGVAFSQNPMNDKQALIEGVYGLNQGLVDGTIQPDRWALDRKTGALISHTAVPRNRIMVPDTVGTKLVPLDAENSKNPPLNSQEVDRVFRLVCRAEQHFAGPQDVEWTFKTDDLLVLQSRPITKCAAAEEGDQRPWYLSLHRTFDNLKALRKKIEKEILPAMAQEAEKLEADILSDFDDAPLADEIERRHAILKKWQEVYKRDCIPFAHGMRLFGRVYNDVINPPDPYEFIDLLHSSSMIALERNRKLQALAMTLNDEPDQARNVISGRWDEVETEFIEALDALIWQFGVADVTKVDQSKASQRQELIPLLLQMAKLAGGRSAESGRSSQELERRFIAAFDSPKQMFAHDLLDLGRASYQLRDDDNAYVDRIKRELHRALREGRRRIGRARSGHMTDLERRNIVACLRDPQFTPQSVQAASTEPTDNRPRKVKPRQLTGQPAGPGVASGPARVIRQANDVFGFQKGEILICDAIQPSMTFAVPLAAGIVERRGGMLIHGAIIAREYGLPCVTGVPEATERIRNGDWVTVDGFLAIVTVG